MGQDAGGVGQRSLVAFMQTNNISYTYWAWNPDSGDTEGILQDNWISINLDKLRILSAYQWSLLGRPQPSTNDRAGKPGAIPNAHQWPLPQ